MPSWPYGPASGTTECSADISSEGTGVDVRLISGSLTGRRAPDQHAQAITVAIDQYAEAALGNRDYFLNKPYSVG